MDPSRIPHVLIVGGGFGGVYAARTFCRLFRPGQAQITLLSEHNYFLFAPLLHEVATGGLSPSSVTEPLLEVFRGTCVTIQTDTLVSLDPIKKIAVTKNGSLAFDYLILATGAVSQINISSSTEHIFPLKNLSDALRIRKRIIELFEEMRPPSFAVVGAGHTGTETVLELADFVRNTLVPYHKRINAVTPDVQISLIGDTSTPVPNSSPAVQRAALRALHKANVRFYQNVRASSVSDTEVLFADGVHVPADLVLWTAGIAPIAISRWNLPISENGRVDTDEFLRTRLFPHIFAVGDVAGRDPRLAQVAEVQGVHAAKNIMAAVRGLSPAPFQYRSRGFLMSLGRGNATGNLFGIPISGPWGWWIWRTVYLFKFLSWRKRFRVALEWTIRLFTPRDITVV